jgi:copper transport protein
VTVLLRCADRSDVAPVKIPLAPREAAAVSGKAGDTAGLWYAFANDSFFLPFPGKWELEIRIMNTDDEETVYRKAQTVY